MHFILNGTSTEAEFDTRTSLLDLLRDHLGLPGAKKGCNQGACGACTVLVDGERILSCLALAVQYRGRSITTIEGLAPEGGLHPLQQAFIEHDGFQCGYCTPGQICSAVGMAEEVRRGVPSNVTHDLTAESISLSHDELRERMERQPVPLRSLQRHRGRHHRGLCRGGGMNPFTYAQPGDVAAALQAGSQEMAKYLGGGTNLVDLMRETLERPAALVDVTGLASAIEELQGGGLLIGAAARNTAVAEHRAIRTRYPVLARAILAGASAQIRNMATLGGNLLQRTRCTYFYDNEGSRCNKRTPGQGCDAMDGFNRIHAILGTASSGVRPSCVATHPSDMCVALATLDAVVHLRGVRGERILPFAELHRLPEDHPEIETALEPGELITAIELPPLPPALRSTYRKVRDRASYAFALISVAAALEVEGGMVKEVRLALGGVAHKPWRASKAEAALQGKPATEASFRAAAEAELADARPLRDNGFKIELARRTMTAVLMELAGMTEATEAKA